MCVCLIHATILILQMIFSIYEQTLAASGAQWNLLFAPPEDPYALTYDGYPVLFER